MNVNKKVIRKKGEVANCIFEEIKKGEKDGIKF